MLMIGGEANAELLYMEGEKAIEEVEDITRTEIVPMALTEMGTETEMGALATNDYSDSV
jgi:hypothetical protein